MRNDKSLLKAKRCKLLICSFVSYIYIYQCSVVLCNRNTLRPTVRIAQNFVVPSLPPSLPPILSGSCQTPQYITRHSTGNGGLYFHFHLIISIGINIYIIIFIILN